MLDNALDKVEVKLAPSICLLSPKLHAGDSCSCVCNRGVASLTAATADAEPTLPLALASSHMSDLMCSMGAALYRKECAPSRACCLYSHMSGLMCSMGAARCRKEHAPSRACCLQCGGTPRPGSVMHSADSRETWAMEGRARCVFNYLP